MKPLILLKIPRLTPDRGHAILTDMKFLRSLILMILVIPVGLSLVSGWPLQAAASTNKFKISQKTVIVRYKGAPTAVEKRVGPGEKVEDLIKRLKNDPRVEYAEPNYLLSAALLPDDTLYNNQWYLRRIKAPEAWELHSASPGVVIAVIDSGVQIAHPDIQPNLWVNSGEIQNNGKDDDRNGYIDDYYGWDFVNNVADPSPKFKPGFTEAGIQHGTIVAGIAAAAGDNGEGIAGVTWDAQIMALKALGDDGDGETSSVIKAIDYAVAKGANIINLSFVGFAYSRSLHDAIERAYNAGVQVVAPAGNEQASEHGVNLDTHPIYPACYRNAAGQPIVIGVAATDGIDQKAAFSGYGKSCIDLSAPGLSFYSTVVYAPNRSASGQFFNQYYDGYWSGTSVAVPLVSGALALIQGANPTLSPRDVTSILLKNTDDINALNPDYRNQLGRGRLNVAAAVADATARAQKREAYFAVVPGDSSLVTVMNQAGETVSRFQAFPVGFKGGVNLTAGDVDGDGNDEIIAAPASGREADLRIFDAQGNFKGHFLAYPASFRGGVNMAMIDYNNDGRQEIVTVPASGRAAEVKIFTMAGKLLKSFLAYPSTFSGGASLAVGNVVGSDEAEIVTGTGKGGIPQVKIFNRQGNVLNSFVAGARRDTSGLRLSLFDADANIRRRQSEILVSRQSGTASASLYDFRGGLRRSWSLFGTNFRGDVKTVAGDLNGDAVKEVIAFPGAGGGPHVRIFDRNGNQRNAFYAFDSQSSAGLNLAIVYLNR